MDYLSLIRKPIDTELQEFISLFNDSLSHTDGMLETVLDHIRKRAGKRMRPMLILLTAKCFGEVNESTQRAAVGLELLHTASLVHDDVVDESLSKISDMFNFMIYVKENPFVQLTDNQCVMFEKYGQLVLLKAGDVGNLFYREVSTNLMRVLFFEVFNVYSQNLLRRNVLKTNKDFVLERFLQIVSKHYSAERSIKYYAGMMGLSPKYLSQICYQVSGKHAGEWIDRFVVSHAKELLSGTDLTIQQISNELHFPNQSFFGKYFRKHVGQSPREYRRTRNLDFGLRN